MMIKEEILEVIEEKPYEIENLQELIDEIKNLKKSYYDKYDISYECGSDYNIIIEALIARKIKYSGE